VTDRSKHLDRVDLGRQARTSAPDPLKARRPPPPAPLPRRLKTSPLHEQVVLLDDGPEADLTCGQVASGPRMSGRRGKGARKAARSAGEERPRSFTPCPALAAAALRAACEGRGQR
jgi:hypothetical protein